MQIFYRDRHIKSFRTKNNYLKAFIETHRERLLHYYKLFKEINAILLKNYF